MMRLLQYNSKGGFSLTTFFANKIPKEYAILSHTWEEEEVTFEDLRDGTGTEKASYKKIRFCGEQARRDGLQYFWVDTCCIDKSSSAELTEAINSMFRWYRESTKCYVYLSDVWKTSIDRNGLGWESAFRESRWFTRGWTLQELIAPTSIEFFSKEGELLGNKSTLERYVCEAAGIPAKVLRGSPLSDFSIAERMLWAGRRKTTREEDQAYSLLGIFDISIPVIYGEGRGKAYRRLLEEIDKASKVTKSSLDSPKVEPTPPAPVRNIGLKVLSDEERIIAEESLADLGYPLPGQNSYGIPRSNFDLQEALFAAVNHGVQLAVIRLLEYEPSLQLNIRDYVTPYGKWKGFGEEPLVNAVRNNDIGMAAILVQAGANPSLGYESPLQHAIKTGNLEMAKLLLQNGASLDRDGNPGRVPLILDALFLESGKDRSCKMVELLLDNGADIEAKDLNERTLLFKAVSPSIGWYPGNHALVHMLLKRGAHVNARNTFGETPLHALIQYIKYGKPERNDIIGLERMRELLIRYGGTVDK